jgi:hypothetical protein
VRAQSPRSRTARDLGHPARALRVDLDQWSELERSAFAEFALVLAQVPELEHWIKVEKHGVAEIIRAKVGATDAEYLRLMQGHVKLKEVMLRLGSLDQG